MVTVAPGSPAFVCSVTTPEIDPVVVCAAAGAASDVANAVSHTILRTRARPCLPCMSPSVRQLAFAIWHSPRDIGHSRLRFSATWRQSIPEGYGQTKAL